MRCPYLLVADLRGFWNFTPAHFWLALRMIDLVGQSYAQKTGWFTRQYWSNVHCVARAGTWQGEPGSGVSERTIRRWAADLRDGGLIETSFTMRPEEHKMATRKKKWPATEFNVEPLMHAIEKHINREGQSRRKFQPVCDRQPGTWPFGRVRHFVRVPRALVRNFGRPEVGLTTNSLWFVLWAMSRPIQARMETDGGDNPHWLVQVNWHDAAAAVGRKSTTVFRWGCSLKRLGVRIKPCKRSRSSNGTRDETAWTSIVDLSGLMKRFDNCDCLLPRAKQTKRKSRIRNTRNSDLELPF
jgi:hypothetical protein